MYQKADRPIISSLQTLTGLCSEGNLSEQNREGKNTVGNDASTDDQGTVFDWPVLQQVGVILGVLLDQLGVIIRKSNESSQGNGSQSILHIFALQDGRHILAQSRSKQSGTKR